ncbi:molybdopterin-synthase adenylyltransferase MoeB [Sansalvadorimonas sp. 2012CJ34-2]|uniref:Molybdopterin-synthase adenylyltransferase MoeB n=1 Tax=Parendozoicomonas callyspongiae TaxID=2942213 RepID=A0ABT0PHW3_9GAMM|nr:molybdopterin-synthase adenylyltransferase MoeB [Sansalvadorimonas sp. 2012CJ34-2]MCL6270337.1 molybdopterin-synthase adenylyltransferase MoeB [Sansalvadorimonas sp. 2012CJ34-2]
MMTDDQLLRYNRQIMIPEFDIAGQEKLLEARVLIIGAGGLGCPVALYLAAAGVGTLVISDDDHVDLSNLQRQIAHTTRDIGKDKVISVNESVHALNPDTHVMAITNKLEGEVLEEQVKLATLVIDCTDNFPSRFNTNRICVKYRTPLVSGAAIGFNGQVAVFNTEEEDVPCYNCLYSDVDEQQLTCSEAGILSPITGVIGSLQATEAIKVITGIGKPLAGRLLVFDGLSMEFRSMNLSRDVECKTCS